MECVGASLPQIFCIWSYFEAVWCAIDFVSPNNSVIIRAHIRWSEFKCSIIQTPLSEVWKLPWETPGTCFLSLKTFWHLNIWAFHKKSFPQASCNMESFTVVDLLSFIQNLVVFHCSTVHCILKTFQHFKTRACFTSDQCTAKTQGQLN